MSLFLATLDLSLYLLLSLLAFSFTLIDYCVYIMDTPNISEYFRTPLILALALSVLGIIFIPIDLILTSKCLKASKSLKLSTTTTAKFNVENALNALTCCQVLYAVATIGWILTLILGFVGKNAGLKYLTSARVRRNWWAVGECAIGLVVVAGLLILLSPVVVYRGRWRIEAARGGRKASNDGNALEDEEEEALAREGEA